MTVMYASVSINCRRDKSGLIICKIYWNENVSTKYTKGYSTEKIGFFYLLVLNSDEDMSFYFSLEFHFQIVSFTCIPFIF